MRKSVDVPVASPARIVEFESPRRSRRLLERSVSSTVESPASQSPMQATPNSARASASRTLAASKSAPVSTEIASAKKRTRRRLATEDRSSDAGYARAFAKWKAVSERPVMPNYCHARTWRGVQCSQLRHRASFFCSQHTRVQNSGRALQYGRYDVPLHAEVLGKCLHRAAVCDQTENFRFYSRERMWDEAAKHGVNAVEELSDEMYTECLCNVNEYYGKNPAQWKTVQSLTPGAGPRSVEDRHDHERAFYCGTIRRFRYYAPSVFHAMLVYLVRRSDVAVSDVSEKVFMEALQLTTDRMQHCHVVRGTPLYMGPQCISHRDDEPRMRFVPREERRLSQSSSDLSLIHI